jgi:hypothetical protein
VVRMPAKAERQCGQFTSLSMDTGAVSVEINLVGPEADRLLSGVEFMYQWN